MSETGQPPTARRRRALAALFVLACVALLGWWFFLRSSPTPEEADGRAWLAAFTELLTDRRLLGARGPAAPAQFSDLRPLSTGACVTEWGKQAASDPIVTYQRLELGRLEGDGCDQAQFGILSTTIRTSDGITPGAFAARLTERFGKPDMQRDTGIHGSIKYDWTILDGVFISVDEPVGLDHFSVLLMRSYGAPTYMPDAADGARFLDRTVALLTGPELAAAHGTAARRLVGGSLLPQPGDDLPCPVTFMSDLKAKDAIADQTTLMLADAKAEHCEDAGFVRLSITIWRRDPVTPQAMVTRIQAKLGEPKVRRDFGTEDILYRWKTGHGTTVEVTEGVTSELDRAFIARAWRE